MLILHQQLQDTSELISKLNALLRSLVQASAQNLAYQTFAVQVLSGSNSRQSVSRTL